MIDADQPPAAIRSGQEVSIDSNSSDRVEFASLESLSLTDFSTVTHKPQKICRNHLAALVFRRFKQNAVHQLQQRRHAAWRQDILTFWRIRKHFLRWWRYALPTPQVIVRVNMILVRGLFCRWKRCRRQRLLNIVITKWLLSLRRRRLLDALIRWRRRSRWPVLILFERHRTADRVLRSFHLHLERSRLADRCTRLAVSYRLHCAWQNFRALTAPNLHHHDSRVETIANAIGRRHWERNRKKWSLHAIYFATFSRDVPYRQQAVTLEAAESYRYERRKRSCLNALITHVALQKFLSGQAELAAEHFVSRRTACLSPSLTSPTALPLAATNLRCLVAVRRWKLSSMCSARRQAALLQANRLKSRRWLMMRFIPHVLVQRYLQQCVQNAERLLRWRRLHGSFTKHWARSHRSGRLHRIRRRLAEVWGLQRSFRLLRSNAEDAINQNLSIRRASIRYVFNSTLNTLRKLRAFSQRRAALRRSFRVFRRLHPTPVCSVARVVFMLWRRRFVPRARAIRLGRAIVRRSNQLRLLLATWTLWRDAEQLAKACHFASTKLMQRSVSAWKSFSQLRASVHSRVRTVHEQVAWRLGMLFDAEREVAKRRNLPLQQAAFQHWFNLSAQHRSCLDSIMLQFTGRKFLRRWLDRYRIAFSNRQLRPILPMAAAIAGTRRDDKLPQGLRIDRLTTAHEGQPRDRAFKSPFFAAPASLLLSAAECGDSTASSSVCFAPIGQRRNGAHSGEPSYRLNGIGSVSTDSDRLSDENHNANVSNTGWSSRSRGVPLVQKARITPAPAAILNRSDLSQIIVARSKTDTSTSKESSITKIALTVDDGSLARKRSYVSIHATRSAGINPTNSTNR